MSKRRRDGKKGSSQAKTRNILQGVSGATGGGSMNSEYGTGAFKHGKDAPP